jgi:hypothetical protein
MNVEAWGDSSYYAAIAHASDSTSARSTTRVVTARVYALASLGSTLNHRIPWLLRNGSKVRAETLRTPLR